MEQRGFGSKHLFKLKLFFSLFSKLNQTKIKKARVKLQAYVTPQILCNPWIQSKIERIRFVEMSKYENSVFPYSVHSTVNLSAWRPRDTNVILMSFFRLFTETINPERNFFFFKMTWQMLLKLTKSVRNCQHPILRRNHQNWNLFFRNFLVKYEPRIKDKELHDEKQKIYTIFLFLFLPFKKLLAKIFFINF